MAANRFDEAAAIYREILQKMPDEPGIMMNLGIALSMAGQPQEAIPPLSRALELRPTLMPAALFLGQSHLDLGQPEQAIAPLQKYVTAQPANLQARQMLASASLMAGRHQQAATEFRKVTQQAPADAKGWYGLVQSYDALSQETLDALSKTADARAVRTAVDGGRARERREARTGVRVLQAIAGQRCRSCARRTRRWRASTRKRVTGVGGAADGESASTRAGMRRERGRGCGHEIFHRGREERGECRERCERDAPEECGVRVPREAVSERDRGGREARGCRVAVLEDARVRGAGVERAGEADRDEAVAGAARAAGGVVSESAASSAIGDGAESGADVRAERSAAAARAGEIALLRARLGRGAQAVRGADQGGQPRSRRAIRSCSSSTATCCSSRSRRKRRCRI